MLEGEHQTQRDVAEALLFARDELGPACATALSCVETQVAVLSRRRAGMNLEDAVLAEAFRIARDDRRVANEFVAYLLQDLVCLGRGALSSGLRRFLDTGDLVNSVIGDLWPKLAELQFESRAQFLSLLVGRLRWKASDHARKLRRRPEEPSIDRDADKIESVASKPSPLSEMGVREQRERLILALTKLSERDRRIMRLHLRGEPLDSLSMELGLSRESAYQALKRAKRRARKLLS